MIITPQILKNLMVGFSHAFKGGVAKAETQYTKITTTIPGTGKSTTYGWLGKWPKFREWVGDRVFKNLAAHAYTIVNKKYESSVEVERDEIEDDEIGVYMPMMEEMGQAASELPDELIFGLLGNGFTELCYDGQNFFDTDHPVNAEVDGSGVNALVSNMTAGLETPWFLLDTTRALKPMIYQLRRKIELKSMTDAKDSESSWLRDVFQFGADGRMNVGFGFWQMAHGSKAALTEANLNAAHAAMRAVKGDGDKALSIKPTTLVVPASLEQQAEAILNLSHLANGASNPMYKKYDLVVSDFL